MDPLTRSYLLGMVAGLLLSLVIDLITILLVRRSPRLQGRLAAGVLRVLEGRRVW